jgi:hypothetical protein
MSTPLLLSNFSTSSSCLWDVALREVSSLPKDRGQGLINPLPQNLCVPMPAMLRIALQAGLRDFLSDRVLR